MQHPQKKKTKRVSIRLVAVLTGCTLTLAAAFVLLLPVIRRQFPAQTIPFEMTQSTVRTLDVREAAQLKSITIYPDGQNGYTLLMQDGTLMLARGEDRIAIDTDYQADILAAVTEINVQDTVTQNGADVSEQLEAMGLNAPQCKAVVRLTDGSEEMFEIGGQVYGGTDYYFRWSGAEGVYTCHSGVLDAFTIAEKLLIPFERPIINGMLLERLTLSNQKGECTVAFRNGTSGRLTAPCAYPMTDDTAQMLMNAAGNIRLGAYEAQLTEENRAEYGFDNPLCTIETVQAEGLSSVVDEDGALQAVTTPAQTLHFVIGRAEGDFFYTCAYQGDVYLISRFLVETLVQTDWRNLMSRTPANMGETNLCTIAFETPDAAVEVQITRTESVLANNQLETDTEGNIVYHTAVTVNGQDAPQAQAETLIERLNAFTVEGSIPAEAEIAAEPRWRISLTAETGETRIVEGYRMDLFSDAVAVNGVMQHYVYDEAIDVFMAGLI